MKARPGSRRPRPSATPSRACSAWRPPYLGTGGPARRTSRSCGTACGSRKTSAGRCENGRPLKTPRRAWRDHAQLHAKCALDAAARRDAHDLGRASRLARSAVRAERHVAEAETRESGFARRAAFASEFKTGDTTARRQRPRSSSYSGTSR